MSKDSVVIIGAGLTGLSLAYFLKKKGIPSMILEARKRIGGRIYTQYKEDAAPIEMGATWLGTKHSALVSLLRELKITFYPQYMDGKAYYQASASAPHQLITLPPDEEPSQRIHGGSSELIQRLHNQLQDEQILTEQIVKEIREVSSGAEIVTQGDTFQAKFVVSTLPPKLLAETIRFDPPLPSSLLEVAETTHTWMGESIKVALQYPKPFWREKETTGTLFCNEGPIMEMYDHSNSTPSGEYYALKGFMNPSYHELSRDQRLSIILRQLTSFYGKEAENFLNYEELIWKDESFTFAPYATPILPHQHNGHPIFQEALFDNRLFLAGSETAPQFPGYMDGAVRSAELTAIKLEKITNNSPLLEVK